MRHPAFAMMAPGGRTAEVVASDDAVGVIDRPRVRSLNHMGHPAQPCPAQPTTGPNMHEG